MVDGLTFLAGIFSGGKSSIVFRPKFQMEGAKVFAFEKRITYHEE